MSKKPESISFTEFLESVPPGMRREVAGLFIYEGEDRIRTVHEEVPVTVDPSDIKLHCSECDGDRQFQRMLSYDLVARGVRATRAPSIGRGPNDVILKYNCRNCRKQEKTFAVRVHREDNFNESGWAEKIGEAPPFGPPIPKRLLRLVDDQRGLLLKGRQIENQGLGIGAFAYYRRVVEDKKNAIFDAIAKAGRELEVGEEFLQSLEDAKNELLFTKSVGHIKEGLPEGLKVKGKNPLKLLHKALSKALHEMSDEECLEKAHDIRVVLSGLIANVDRVLADDREVNDAVKRLSEIK